MAAGGPVAVTWRCTGVGGPGLTAPREADGVWEELLFHGRADRPGVPENSRRHVAQAEGKIGV